MCLLLVTTLLFAVEGYLDVNCSSFQNKTSCEGIYANPKCYWDTVYTHEGSYSQCMTADDKYHLHTFYLIGAAITILAGVFVISTYAFNKSLREHPADLVVARVIFNTLFGAIFVCLYFDEQAYRKCNIYSPLTLFALLSSTFYFACISLSLWTSLLNPFSTVAPYVSILYIAVLVMSGLLTMIYISLDKHEYHPALKFCWISIVPVVNIYNTVLFYLWLGLTILIGFLALRKAWMTLRRGLPTTLKLRWHILMESMLYTGVFSFYWLVLGLIWIDLSYINKSGNKVTSILFAVFVGVRGLIDVIIWIFRWSRTKTQVQSGSGDVALRVEVLSYAMNGIYQAVCDARKNVTVREMPANGLPRRVDYPTDLDVNPLKFPTTAAASVQVSLPQNSVDIRLLSSKGSASTEVETEIVKTVTFIDYAPQVFRHLRRRLLTVPYGRNADDEYLESIFTMDKIESLAENSAWKHSEGRSGSFFYFTDDGKFAIKLIPRHEALALLRMLSDYVNYVESNPNTLINRIFGFHSLKVYDITKYIIVLGSCFSPDHFPHERYDIKGSYVGRNAQVRKVHNNKGKLVVSGSRIDYTMKDNDMHKQVVLDPRMCNSLLKQLENDSKFLADQNIMDYSLLLGVFYVKILQQGIYDKSPSLFERPVGNSISVTNASEKDMPFQHFETAEAKSCVRALLHDCRNCYPGDGTSKGPPDEESRMRVGDTLYQIELKIKEIKKEYFPVDVTIYENVNIPLPEDAEMIIHELTELHNAYSRWVTNNAQLPSLLQTSGTSKDDSTVLQLIPVTNSNQDDLKTPLLYNEQPSDASRQVLTNAREKPREPCKSYSSFRAYQGGVKAKVMEGQGLYYFGIIDTLQEWNIWKRLERWWKVWVKRELPDGISAINPEKYQKRFMSRMREVFVTHKDFLRQEDISINEFRSTTVQIYPSQEEVDESLHRAKTGESVRKGSQVTEDSSWQFKIKRWASGEHSDAKSSLPFSSNTALTSLTNKQRSVAHRRIASDVGPGAINSMFEYGTFSKSKEHMAASISEPCINYRIVRNHKGQHPKSTKNLN